MSRHIESLLGAHIQEYNLPILSVKIKLRLKHAKSAPPPSIPYLAERPMVCFGEKHLKQSYHQRQNGYVKLAHVLSSVYQSSALLLHFLTDFVIGCFACNYYKLLFHLASYSCKAGANQCYAVQCGLCRMRQLARNLRRELFPALVPLLSIPIFGFYLYYSVVAFSPGAKRFY